eukprot:4250035-Prymnesium_polylepis.1
MALSDLRRLASAAARHRTENNGTRLGETLAWVDERTLLQKVNMTLVAQASFPAGVALERGMLVLYEDLQAQRLLVLRSVLAFVGVDRLPPVQRELERQEAEELRAASGSFDSVTDGASTPAKVRSASFGGSSAAL